MKKLISLLTVCAMLTAAGCGSKKNTEDSSSEPVSVTEAVTEAETEAATAVPTEAPTEAKSGTERYKGMTAEQICATLSLEEKAYQMQIPAIYRCSPDAMTKKNFGSILSTVGNTSVEDWNDIIGAYQDGAMKSGSPIPFIYGQDSVHGVNYSTGTVIFPHNINIGCANDPELTYKMAQAVADEIKLTKMIWNYAPCVAVARDPRWGRTYESYSSDPAIVKSLSGEFARGMIENGIVICPKHFIGDGSTRYGTGETTDGETRLIDRGNAEMSQYQINEQLEIYKNLIDLGAQSIMISHSALNGVKMHENKHMIEDVLRVELGFKGVVVSDWESIKNIESTADYKQQIITAINSGIDWLMEPNDYEKCAKYIVEAVNEGSITKERIDEAVTRIIQLKLDAGLFDDPYLEKLKTKQTEVGSDEYRDIARKIAEESLVLLKNDNKALPLKKGTKVFIMGPAADDVGVQCGGWTGQWLGLTDEENRGKKAVEGGTTILDGLNAIAEEYELTIITDEKKADEADVTLLCLGEKPYAEWHGDTEDMSITGELSLTANISAIESAATIGNPIVTLIVAGRNVILGDYINDWDSVVMCGLPGSEGKAVANVLTGKSDFKGRLSMPWYESIEALENGEEWMSVGDGIDYTFEADEEE